MQRFLDAMVPGAIERDDDLVPRMLARPQDLTIGDEEWRWYASPIDTEDALVAMGASGGLKLTISVEIPESDLPEVERRLKALLAGAPGRSPQSESAPPRSRF
ncbi:MAG: hypothetical protein H0W98_04430 [Chloroflexi bacterium]|nr:hypothetical protein [Chloroflexota bacterium]